MFPQYPIGVLQKFEDIFCEWRGKMKKDEENQKIYKPKSPSIVVATGIVFEILSSSENSKNFHENIDKTKPLSKTERKELNGYILNFIFDRKQVLGRSEFAILAKDIVNVFPCEESSLYYDEVTKTGSLYYEHNNKAKILRDKNLLPRSDKIVKKRKIAQSPEDQENQDENKFTIDQVASNNLIKVATSSMPLLQIYEHWKHSAPIRMNLIKNIKTNGKITSILDEYPLLKRADGAALVSHLFFY
jgi:hypothetical protein